MLCAICNREFDPQQSTALPFCPVRCQQIDLGRWLDEGYGLPHVPSEDEEEPGPGYDPAEND